MVLAHGRGCPEEKSSLQRLAGMLYGVAEAGKHPRWHNQQAKGRECFVSKKNSKLKDAHGIQSWGRKLIKEPREGEEIFFGNCSLGSALVLNQSFLFPWRCTLRQGTKIDLGMFQALSSAMSTYHSLPPFRNLSVKTKPKINYIPVFPHSQSLYFRNKLLGL